MGKTFRHRRIAPANSKCIDNSREKILVLLDGVKTDLTWWQLGKSFPVFLRRLLLTKESKRARKRHWRSHRANVKDRLRHCDIDNIPRLAKTQGWMTH
jgi:hypothetical protein